MLTLEKKLFIQQNYLIVLKEEFGQVNEVFAVWTKYFLDLTKRFFESTKFFI